MYQSLMVYAARFHLDAQEMAENACPPDDGLCFVPTTILKVFSRFTQRNRNCPFTWAPRATDQFTANVTTPLMMIGPIPSNPMALVGIPLTKPPSYISVIKMHFGANLPAGRFGGRTAHAPAILQDGGAQGEDGRTDTGTPDCGLIRSVLSMFVQRYQYELILSCWKLWEADLPSTPLVSNYITSAADITAATNHPAHCQELHNGFSLAPPDHWCLPAVATLLLPPSDKKK
ncbi:unnamed protein product [Ranitomeya imitator]|uniref:Uncharacterized protein n=1 Tax=Ranitomeya imitator TaxID=111125 RepID=A0ABN9KLW4_9NEOB|nr:unnamed protein product [Ranitomeya imitator]